MYSVKTIGSSLHTGKYRADIDGLRAVAVTSVVACHASPTHFPGGFVGVDIFFVISGYLISNILIGDLEKQRFSLPRFYDRRIRRIFPALITVLLVTLLIGWFVLFRSEFQMLGSHVVASTLFSENFKLWSESGYFDVSSELKPLLHLWSLAIEEQFYIFWPLIMYFTRGRHLRFFAMLVVLGFTSFAINVFDTHNNPIAAYYSPLGRVWELMVGGLLAYLKAYRPQLLAQNQNIQSWLGSAFIVASLVLVNPDLRFPGFWALLPTIGAFLVLSAGESAWINRRVLSATPFVWCGLVSYPLYLWHWVLLSYSHIFFGEKVPLPVLVSDLGAALIAATLTFLFIERPFRVKSTSIAKPVGLIAVMVATLCVASLVTAHVIGPRLDKFDAPTKDPWQFLRSRTANFDTKDGIGIYPLHTDRPNTVLFIGDSHIAQYAERINKVIGEDSSRPGAILVIGGGCIPIDGVSTPAILRRGCWPLRERAYQMAHEQRFKTVVIGGAWNLYFHTTDYVLGSGRDQRFIASPPGEAAALARLGQTIAQLVKSGKRVVLVLDNPVSYKLNFKGASVRLNFSTTHSSPNQFVKVDSAEWDLHQKMLSVAHQAGATVIDAFTAVCTLNTCRATTETGQPLYEDSGHFNPDWAISQARFIDAATAR